MQEVKITLIVEQSEELQFFLDHFKKLKQRDRIPTAQRLTREYIDDLLDRWEVEVSKEAVPYKEIVELYHRICPMLLPVRALSAARKGNLRSRWKTFSVWRGTGDNRELIKFNNIEAWRRYFTFIANHCSFMHGKNDQEWVANFDFCIRESAMIGVMENKYADRKSK